MSSHGLAPVDCFAGAQSWNRLACLGHVPVHKEVCLLSFSEIESYKGYYNMYLVFTTPPLVHLSFFVTESVTYNAMALLLIRLFCLSSSVQLIF